MNPSADFIIDTRHGTVLGSTGGVGIEPMRASTRVTPVTVFSVGRCLGDRRVAVPFQRSQLGSVGTGGDCVHAVHGPFGCGIDVSRLQFEYGRRITAKPILGCGVVLNGRRAFFEPWLLKSRWPKAT